MGRFLIGLLVGSIIGGAAILFVLAGGSGPAAPGVPIAKPDPAAQAPGTAQIVLRQDFFNTVLATIFTEMQPPAFPLTFSGQPDNTGACASEIKLLREGSGVQTAVRLDGDVLSAPLAFSGSYNSMFGCLQFTGWAEAGFELRYDAATQSVYGQVKVNAVSLDGVNPVLAGVLTPLVQSTLNARVNPILIVDGRQIGVSLPVAAANAELKAEVRDIRAEVKENALSLYVTYGFEGAPLQPRQ